MRNKFTLLLQLLLPCAIFAQNYSFTRMTSCPEAVYGPESFTINDSVYWVGGLIGRAANPPANMTQHVWMYNTTNDTWTRKNDFPGVSVYQGSAFVINGMAYVVNGFDSTTMGTGPNNLWQYDPTNDTWANKAPFPGSTRYTTASFSLNGKGYIGLGFRPLQKDLWQYDPTTDSWTQKADFPGAARQTPVYFTMGNYAYVGMGAVGDNFGGYYLQSDFYKYDPNADTWSPISIFPGNPSTTPYTFTVNNDVYLVGGGDQNGINYFITGLSKNVWKYTPATDTWALWGLFPDSALGNGATGSANGAGWMGLGDVNIPTYGLSYKWYRFGPGVGPYSCNATVTPVQINNASRNFEALGNFAPTAVLSWSFGDGGTGTGTSVNHSYTTDGAYTVILTVTDTAEACTFSDTTYVGINGISNCSTSVTNTNFNSLYTLSANPTGVPPYTYMWSNNLGTNFSVSPDPQVTIPFGDTATYCLTITDSTGCQAHACETIIGAPDTSTSCQTYLYIFPQGNVPGLYYGVIYHTGSAPPATYTWNFGDGTIQSLPPGDTLPNYTYSNFGFFDVCLTIVDSDGCSSSFCDSVFYAYKVGGGPMRQFQVVPQSTLAAGIPTISGPLQLSAFPNPTTDELAIVTNSKIDNLTVYSAIGQMVLQQESPANNTIHVNTLAAGIYFVDVRIGKATGRVKFVKFN